MERTGWDKEQYQQRTEILYRIWRRARPVLRHALGWTFIGLGLLGLVLPVLQGIVFLVIGIMLVGRRNRLIRWAGVHIKLLLRRWARTETPIVGSLGRMALGLQQEISRQRRRLHWWYLERRQSGFNRYLSMTEDE